MPISKLFSYQGTFDRKGFFISFLLIVLLAFVSAAILLHFSQEYSLKAGDLRTIKISVGGLILIVWLPFIVRRLNDIGLSSTWSVVFVLSFLLNHAVGLSETITSGSLATILYVADTVLKFIAALMLLFLFFKMSADEYIRKNIHEASTSFDLEQVEPFLKSLQKLFDKGFDNEVINKLVEFTEETEVKEAREMLISVVYKGTSTCIGYGVIMDDIDTADLYFITTEDLSNAISDAMSDFSKSMGI